MTREALRTLLTKENRNWDRGQAGDTRVPQKTLDRHLLELAEARASATPRERPSRHKGIRARARVSGFPYSTPSQI